MLSSLRTQIQDFAHPVYVAALLISHITRIQPFDDVNLNHKVCILLNYVMYLTHAHSRY